MDNFHTLVNWPPQFEGHVDWHSLTPQEVEALPRLTIATHDVPFPRLRVSGDLPTHMPLPRDEDVRAGFPTPEDTLAVLVDRYGKGNTGKFGNDKEKLWKNISYYDKVKCALASGQREASDTISPSFKFNAKEKYHIDNDTLYQRKDQKKGNNKWQVVVPIEDVHRILCWAHSHANPSSEHAGRDKMFDLLSTLYNVDNFERQQVVQAWINKCGVCGPKKQNLRKPRENQRGPRAARDGGVTKPRRNNVRNSSRALQRAAEQHSGAILNAVTAADNTAPGLPESSQGRQQQQFQGSFNMSAPVNHMALDPSFLLPTPPQESAGEGFNNTTSFFPAATVASSAPHMDIGKMPWEHSTAWTNPYPSPQSQTSVGYGENFSGTAVLPTMAPVAPSAPPIFFQHGAQYGSQVGFNSTAAPPIMTPGASPPLGVPLQYGNPGAFNSVVAAPSTTTPDTSAALEAFPQYNTRAGFDSTLTLPAMEPEAHEYMAAGNLERLVAHNTSQPEASTAAPDFFDEWDPEKSIDWDVEIGPHLGPPLFLEPEPEQCQPEGWPEV